MHSPERSTRRRMTRSPELRYQAALPALVLVVLLAGHAPAQAEATPVTVKPVAAPRAMVVAGHPQVAAIGLEVLRKGGNAIDAAIAVSLALGVAEPYGSGLGGKLMLLYHEAASGRTFAVDAMDAAPASLDAKTALDWPAEDRSAGWRAVAVPGLAAGLELAHDRWGCRPWAENFAPAIALAREGFEVLPKTRSLFEERIERLRGDSELARIFLPNGELPDVGQRLANPDLAATMERLARDGVAAFYEGPIAAAIAGAARAGGGVLTRADFAAYEARVVEPVRVSFHGYEILAGPPPTTGGALVFPALKALEPGTWTSGTLRTAEHLDRIGRIWREVVPQVYRTVGDDGHGPDAVKALLQPENIAEIRAAADQATLAAEAAWLPMTEPDYAMACTTHFVVVDAGGNIVCATQSLSLHFGAGVVAPGTGVILNDSMSNFAYAESTSPNFIAPGRRPRSTIAPMLVLRDGAPVLAIGLPGGSRIPTAMLQVLLDRLAFDRPLADAMGDTRIHINPASRNRGVDAFENEDGLTPEVVAGLEAAGWKVETIEPPGTGLRFGGFAAVEILSDGTRVGYADPRRTNTATGF